MKKIRLSLVDKHTLFRDAVASMLSASEDIDVIHSVGSGKELINKLQRRKCDIVLTELNMPGMDGFKITAHIQEYFPKTKVIALTMFDEKRFIEEMIKMGARAYLFKDITPVELTNAIKVVHEGEFYFNNAMTEALMKGWLNRKKRVKLDLLRSTNLTKRELQILKLICGQHTNTEIAQKLHLSPRTVDNYRNILLEKTNVKNTVGLVIFAIENNLFEASWKLR